MLFGNNGDDKLWEKWHKKVKMPHPKLWNAAEAQCGGSVRFTELQCSQRIGR